MLLVKGPRVYGFDYIDAALSLIPLDSVYIAKVA